MSRDLTLHERALAAMAVHHTGNLDEARRILDSIQDLLDDCRLVIVYAGDASGAALRHRQQLSAPK